MDRHVVWEIIAYGWTEIGIGEDECARLAAEGRLVAADLPAIRRIFFRDVCASFAVEAFLVFPLMLWMLMPDWGFETAWLRRRVDRWYARPYWTHWLNPLRVLGYPVALFFGEGYLRMLHRVLRSPSRLGPHASTAPPE
jgi:hypothetical protein